MIIADRKNFEEIKEKIKDYDKVLILGCGTCVSVCMAGGEKEVEILASELKIASGLDSEKHGEIGEATVQRQCDKEYIEPLIQKCKGYDAVLSMACGAGVQLLADMLAPTVVIPALNTRFIGISEGEGMWAERCRACGDCMLGELGGICPITMCTKGLTSGGCGGSKLGKCEAGDGRDCAWVLIYDRLKQQGRLENLKKVVAPRDYSRQDHPAKRVAEAYRKEEPAPAKKAEPVAPAKK